MDKYIGFSLDIKKTTEYQSLATVVPYGAGVRILREHAHYKENLIVTVVSAGEIWYLSEIEKLSSIVVSTEILSLI